MKTVLQVEFSPSLLAEKAAVLERNGYRVISAPGSFDARGLGVFDPVIGVVVIGHGAPWLEREGLIAHFREALPRVPIVALLRHNDDSFSDADFNCPADNPPLWERTVIQALLRTEKLQQEGPDEKAIASRRLATARQIQSYLESPRVLCDG